MMLGSWWWWWHREWNCDKINGFIHHTYFHSQTHTHTHLPVSCYYVLCSFSISPLEGFCSILWKSLCLFFSANLRWNNQWKLQEGKVENKNNTYTLKARPYIVQIKLCQWCLKKKSESCLNQLCIIKQHTWLTWSLLNKRMNECMNKKSWISKDEALEFLFYEFPRIQVSFIV